MEFLSTFFYEAMIRISSTFLFDATGNVPQVSQQYIKNQQKVPFCTKEVNGKQKSVK
ncbi:hypothetical protein [Thermospira aquatica]|uniref:Uncharacterized protein n=1 Tax=Thermospira aquatica TaxID=2828656 RepID=A0AAX3BH22_9SPIR|nr:hypothetical protein [Thermospira aquatica]URA10756.1 hypothetical protein KDW03_02835 [Thermospira aquatica]